MVDIPLVKEFREPYRERLELGLQLLAESEVVIVGLVRNVASVLGPNVQKLSALRERCKSLHFFLFENDSTDGTPDALARLRDAVPGFDYLSQKLDLKAFGSVKDTPRIEALARHRRTCQREVAERFSHATLTVVIDFDFQFFNINGLINSVGWIAGGEFSAMAGYSYYYKAYLGSRTPNFMNYDSWAYRGDWWEDLEKYAKPPRFGPMLWFTVSQPLVGLPPTRVNSAFGGCAVYRTEHFLKGVYSHEDCEHVCFHKSLYASAPDFRLGANPSQIMVF
jgi:hypothetical protein